MDDVTSWTTATLDSLPMENGQGLLRAAAALGLLYCFLGYGMFRFVLGLTGFLLAGAVAAFLAGWASSGHLIAMGIALVIGGACGAVALVFLYRLGVFVVGAAGAAVAAWQVLGASGAAWVPWAIIGISLAGGVVALLLERPVVTFATAAIGAWLATGAVAILLVENEMVPWLAEAGEADPSQPLGFSMAAWVVFGTWAALTLLGAAAQFRRSGRKKAKKE